MAEILRTPEERFNNLDSYPFEPHYLEDLDSVPGARMHYVDEGPRDSKEVFLCLHGAPTWSYVYRKMIPIFAAQGHRVIALDLIGCGRSDKLLNQSDYSYHLHRNSLIEFIEKLDLTNITLVCQDWGGLLGLTLPMDMPGRFKRLLIMNTTLPATRLRFNPTFRVWRLWARLSPNIHIGNVVKICEWSVTKTERESYNAPYPDRRYKAGVRAFPALVPLSPKDEGAAILERAAEWFPKNWQGDSFMAIGTKDHALGRNTMLPLRKLIPNCPEPLLVKAGHYVQEQGVEIAEGALQHFGLTKEALSCAKR